MDQVHFAMLMSYEQLIETVLGIAQWTQVHIHSWPWIKVLWSTRISLRTTALNKVRATGNGAAIVEWHFRMRQNRVSYKITAIRRMRGGRISLEVCWAKRTKYNVDKTRGLRRFRRCASSFRSRRPAARWRSTWFRLISNGCKCARSSPCTTVTK